MNVYALRMSLAEKALSLENELDFYLPKHFVLRRYASGMKRILVPLLPSMVFVRGRFSEVHRFQSIYSFIIAEGRTPDTDCRARSRYGEFPDCGG